MHTPKNNPLEKGKNEIPNPTTLSLSQIFTYNLIPTHLQQRKNLHLHLYPYPFNPYTHTKGVPTMPL